MNDSLIKQLELAIAVERGDLPLSEVQLKLKRLNEFSDASPIATSASWNFEAFEYRRKPKPLECEVVVIDGQIVGFNGSTPLSDELRQKALVVKMKEVL